MVLEKKIVLHYKSVEANDPKVQPILTASWLQRLFYVFPILSLWELSIPGAWPIWTPGA